jgi:GT2 family glycosyltransferase
MRTLRSVVERTDPVYEVIAVDNASPDRTRRWLAEEVAGATVVLHDRNVGFAAAVNRAALEARAPAVCLLNPDVEVHPGWLPPLLRALEDPRVGAVVPRYLYPDGRLQEAGSVVGREGRSLAIGKGGDPEDPVHRFPRVVDYGSAACLVLRRSSFHLVGGLDPVYRPAYLEDVDLAFALREHGLRTLYEPRSTVVHAGAGSTDDDTRRQLIERNRLIFEERWRRRLRWRPRWGPTRYKAVALRDLETPDRLLVLADAVPGADSRLERLLTEASLGWETARVTLMALDRSGDLQRLLDRGVEVAPATPEELEARLFHASAVLIAGGEVWERLGAEVLRSQPQAVRILDAQALEERSELSGIADAVLCATEEDAERVRRSASDAPAVVGGAAEAMALLGAEPPQLARPSLIPTDTPPTSTRSR